MPFRIREEAREWFKGVRSEFDLDFDSYYFCALAGLATHRKAADFPSSGTAELVDDFPGPYRPNGRMVVALFLTRELRSLGVSYTERAALHRAVQRLVNPLSASHLSEEGMRELNKYAWEGLDVLREWFEDRPRALETFLPEYKARIDEAAPRA